MLGTDAFGPGKWEPNWLYNVLYALAALKLRAVDQLDGLADDILDRIEAEGGFGFTYSIEKYQERLAELDSRKGDDTLREEVASGETTGYTEAELLAQINPERYA